MFTQCPQCSTVFRIYAEQLAQARGRVRCGLCNNCFNALESLAETLDAFTALSSPGIAPEKAVETHEQVEHIEAYPRTEALTAAPPLAAQESSAVSADGAAPLAAAMGQPLSLTPVAREKLEGFTAPWESAAITQLTPAGLGARAPEPAAPAESISATGTAPPESAADKTMPLSTQADKTLPDLGIIAAEPRPIAAAEASGAWLKTGLWAAANIVLIAVLLGQYTYFNRSELAQYPGLRPWLTRLCAVLACDTPLRRDVSRITLANRIVQSDPNHPNALLIDATLINEADFPQPFPLLEIRFSDLNNQLIAGRRFRPGEYLTADVSPHSGMPPHQAVHVILEIVDPGKDAVSFQFDLLEPL